MKHETWKIGEDSKDYPIKTRILRVIDDGINPKLELDVCDVLPSTDKKRHINLIAAAPDLLEALERLLKEARQNSFNANGSLSDTPAEVAAQAAISKAKGE